MSPPRIQREGTNLSVHRWAYFVSRVPHRPGTQPALGDPALSAITSALYTGDPSGITCAHASTTAFRKTAQWLTLRWPHIPVTAQSCLQRPSIQGPARVSGASSFFHWGTWLYL